MIEKGADTQIRTARLEDGPALATLLRSIGWFARMMDEPVTVTQQVVTRQVVTRQLAACLADSSHTAYVATGDDERLVGYVVVHWLPYLFLPGPEGFVSDLFVAEAARGRGVGKALLGAADVRRGGGHRLRHQLRPLRRAHRTIRGRK
jgi:GNAT superfamily N-acetyltransferase